MKSTSSQTVKHLCIYEDDGYKNLLPLAHTRPVFALRCGAMTLAERITAHFPNAKIFYQCRPYMASVFSEQNSGSHVNVPVPEKCLFINGRLLLDPSLAKLFATNTDATFLYEGEAVAFWNVATARKVSVDASIIRWPWDLVTYNGAMITADFKKGNQRSAIAPGGGRLINRSQIVIGKKSKIKLGAVLDAENGPIIIGNNVTVMSNAVIEGPCYIGDDTLIKIGAKIYGKTSIGPVCKVGGEVEGSIIHGFSNKQHDGFLGHSYIGEWCNLGADTNTSDLKNNYSAVKVMINGNEVNSGSQFVGLTMGDHSKSGINTMFNTGTIVGVSANVFGSGFPPKTIPSFSWCDVPALTEYRLDKALDVAFAVMARRKVTITENYAVLLQYVYELTRDERASEK